MHSPAPTLQGGHSSCSWCRNRVSCSRPQLLPPRHRCRSRHTTCAVADTGQPIMVNACTGKMGHATAEAVVRAGLQLVPFSFTGSSEAVAVGNVGVEGIPVELVAPEERQEAMTQVKEKYKNLVIIDFTLPQAVNDNAAFYCYNQVPFVMGTTGGDRHKLLQDTKNADVYAVIAPQMGKQVVAFQAMMDNMAKEFPGAFSGYKLEVTESHQRTKADTSGTAKAVVGSLQQLGLDFSEASYHKKRLGVESCNLSTKLPGASFLCDTLPALQSQIKKIREKGAQLDQMHVPENALNGHAFHTYQLTSPDGSVSFQFQHNVVGRQIYAEGTVDAALFLGKQIRDKSEKRIFNMIDVLKAGAMR